MPDIVGKDDPISSNVERLAWGIELAKKTRKDAGLVLGAGAPALAIVWLERANWPSVRSVR